MRKRENQNSSLFRIQEYSKDAYGKEKWRLILR